MASLLPTEALKTLFQNYYGELPDFINPLPLSGSDRRYFRMKSPNHKALAALHLHKEENLAFIEMSRHFAKKGIPVPELYAEDKENCLYLLEDLGDKTLFNKIQEERKGEDFPETLILAYQKVLDLLLFLQFEGDKGFDYQYTFPVPEFNREAMDWDLNYFKYFFLKVSGCEFHEAKLSADFNKLLNQLEKVPRNCFMHRDFQSRNIMWKNEKPFVIDYQGGRKGPATYDVAALLWQARAAIPEKNRADLVEYYYEKLLAKDAGTAAAFKEHLYAFVLHRCLQVLGAYGFRGLYEKRAHFLKSIPFALQNLQSLLLRPELPELPELKRLAEELLKSPLADKSSATESGKLTIRVQSFSYKQGIPGDPSGNGGGFVFDCRGIHNPGRYAPYKHLTGQQQPVIDFLLENSNIQEFIANSRAAVEPTINTYKKRGFEHLMLSFGCTGGQHRSVYSAEQTAAWIKAEYPELRVILRHLVIGKE